MQNKHKLLVLKISEEEIYFLRTFNDRFGKLMRKFGAPNSRCLKSSLILALLLHHYQDVFIIIGVSRNRESQGHAWVEKNGHVISREMQSDLSQYIVLKKLRLNYK